MNAPIDKPQLELPPLPDVRFDPALFLDAGARPAPDEPGAAGLRQHLQRYSAQLSPQHAIARLEDPVWRAAWDAVLAGMAGARILFCGSELGVLALRALEHGAAHALCVEPHALDARIATGMAQKHFLAPWHARHGEQIRAWSEQQRQASFEEFTKAIDIAAAGHPLPEAVAWDCVVFPQIDHSLLGTGIVKAVRDARGRSRHAPARIFPGKARVYAMGIEWAYPGADADLAAVERLRWNMFPQALALPPGAWCARTEAVKAGEIDFADFAETTWELALPATGGRVDAIVYWFELDLGAATICNAPGSRLQCIRPAFQYTDPVELAPGGALRLHVQVREDRLHFATLPPAARQRGRMLDGGALAALADGRRHEAYRGAIAAALADRHDQLVLDIGAGCGLAALAAARSGAQKVVACDTNAALVEAGREVLAHSGVADKVTLLAKDCRALRAPDDLARRADLAILESFDCSLIGEGVLHFLSYAREHLLAQDARYLPAGARIRAMLVESRIGRIWDVDASLLNPYRASPGIVKVDAATLAYRALSEPFDVFAFDFDKAGPEPDEKQLQVPALADGVAGAVLLWFDLRFDDMHWISNAPGAQDAFQWQQGLQFLPELRVQAGAALPLVARHDGSELRFQWAADGIDKEALSKLPRFDPRWLAASSMLEQQTQGLLQHCAANPDDYAQVARLAQRFAVDPGAYGIDPAIAQRFAAMFLNR